VEQHFEIIHWDINNLDYVSSLKYHQQSNLIIGQTYSNIAVGVAGCIPQTKKLGKNTWRRFRATGWFYTK